MYLVTGGLMLFECKKTTRSSILHQLIIWPVPYVLSTFSNQTSETNLGQGGHTYALRRQST